MAYPSRKRHPVYIASHTWSLPLSAEHRIVLAMVEHYDERGVCFVSDGQLAVELGVSEERVQHILAELETGGYIETQHETFTTYGEDRARRILTPGPELRRLQ